jgi:hypothetical protein
MNYYELQSDGSVGRFTTSLKVAEANNLKNFTDEEILPLENKYYLKSKYDEIIESDEYKERQKQKERERLDTLYMTRSDFFDGFIMAFGLGQAELRVIIEQILNSINITDVEIKVALNNYDNALNFYRKHTLFVLLNNVEIPISEDITLIFTSDIWDKFFDTKDYKELQKAIKVKPEPVDDDSDSDMDTDDENTTNTTE